MLKNQLKKHSSLLIVLFFSMVGYLYKLTQLPVFADEAIYIRWSQLIIDDWQRYLFFPLNDGKTPLFIWSLVIGQLTAFDPLWIARFTSVLISMVLISVTGALITQLGGSKRAATIGSIAMAGLPFWFFSGRLALIDQMLVMWIALATLMLLRYLSTDKTTALVLSGVFLGLGFWTKLPTILALPMLAVLAIGYPFILKKNYTRQRFFKVLLRLTISFGIAVCIFALLKLQPAFGQLFSRGGDFLYPLSELSPKQLVENLVNHTRDFFTVFSSYLTVSALSLTVSALFLPKFRRQILLLIFSAMAFSLPIMLMGKVIYPRYLLPAALPITIAIVFAIENFIVAIDHEKKLLHKTFLSLFLALMLAHVVSYSSAFWLYAWINPNRLPLTKTDTEQYLSEWSSGNGISQTADAILKAAQTKKTLVLTEGYFGTLPDGILLYLHNKNVERIFIEGIGQPVRSIPPQQLDHAKQFDQVWLVVNSHRLELSPPPQKLLARYCRLDGDPCLEVWDITTYP